MRAILVGFFAFIFSINGVRGQSAQDTVAFIVLGIEDGTIFGSDAEANQWSRARNGVYVLRGKDVAVTFSLNIEVTQNSKCAFEIAYKLDASKDNVSLEYREKIDFSRISSITTVSSGGRLFRSGLGEVGAVCSEARTPRQYRGCNAGNAIAFGPDSLNFVGDPSAVRLESAVSYFKREFCPMKAF